MGQKFLTTKTKDKAFNIKKDSTDKFDGSNRPKLGTAKRPLKLVVKTEEKREELRAFCDEHEWAHRIKVKPSLAEDITDLEAAQREGVTKVNEINLGRNEPCFCGSGKKYKKCCLNK